MACHLPALAPRLPGHPAPEAGTQERHGTKEHTEEEWEAIRDTVQVLYIRDGRKLCETMAIIERRHGFWATEQMYKKRLKKWNLRKRVYRKANRDRSQTAVSSGEESQTADEPMTDEQEPTAAAAAAASNEEHHHMSPSMSPPAASAVSTTFAPAFEPTPAPVVLALNRQPSPDARDPCTQLEVILGSVMTWSMGKLEAAAPGVMTTDPMSRYLASPNRPPAQDSRTMYRTFELVFDLWARGQGHLAGLAARRGFRSLEYVLTEDHPDLVWHMLDTIYDMVDKGHLQLLALFLDHAAAISDHCLPGQHPLRRILAQLRRSDYRSPRGRQHVCHVLRQAWLRNVDILGRQIADSSSSPPSPGSSSDFSPSGSSSTSSALASSRYLWLYEQLIWDARTRLRKGSGLDKRAGDMAAALQALSRTIAAAEAVDTCEKLRVQALMLEFTQMDLGDRAAAHGLALALLRDSDSSRSDARSAARFQAYARKMLSRLDAHGCRWDDAEDNLRLAVRKREAAHGTTNDIRVVRDMWVLAAYYERLGRRGEAQKVAGDAIERATVWLNDAVPNDGL